MARANAVHQRKVRPDVKGKVRVVVYLADEEGKRVTGNLSRSFTIRSTKVSDVAGDIDGLYPRPDERERHN